MASKEYIKRLQREITHMHGCVTTFIGSQPVRETFEGQTVWDGDVQVFEIIKGHPIATTCYAWSCEEGSTERFVAILGLPPLANALDAVKAFTAAERKRKR